MFGIKYRGYFEINLYTDGFIMRLMMDIFYY